jgi:hypothetical protein
LLASAYTSDYNALKDRGKMNGNILVVKVKDIPLNVRLFVEEIGYDNEKYDRVYVVKRKGSIRHS